MNAVTVTMNPAVDVSVRVTKLLPGTLHRVPAFQQDPGGKGINVSKALKAFQIPTIATGFLGGDRGKWLENELHKLGIRNQFVTVDQQTRMNIKITDEHGQLTEINSEASSITEQNLDSLLNILRNIIDKDSLVVFSGKLPSNCSVDWYRHAILEVKRLGARTVLDTSGSPLGLGIEAKPFLVKPNQQELEELTGRTLSSIDDVHRAGRELISAGVTMVVISLGEHGLVALNQGEAYHVKVPNIVVQSSVGAGDTTVAGLIYGLYHQKTFTETILWSAAAGTAAVTKAGSKQPSIEDVVDILSSVQIEKLEVR